MLDDETLTELLGPACPDCSWRMGQHRPSGQFVGPACPRYREAPPVSAPA
jgi:hypothetical protein